MMDMLTIICHETQNHPTICRYEDCIPTEGRRRAQLLPIIPPCSRAHSGSNRTSDTAIMASNDCNCCARTSRDDVHVSGMDDLRHPNCPFGHGLENETCRHGQTHTYHA